MSIPAIVAPAGSRVPVLDQIDDATKKTVDKVISIFKGIGFVNRSAANLAERDFQKWKSEKLGAVLGEFIKVQSPNNASNLNTAITALKENIKKVDGVLASLPLGSVKEKWLAFRHALIGMKNDLSLFAAFFLLKKLKDHNISKEEYPLELDRLLRCEGGAEEDAYVEPTYAELAPPKQPLVDMLSDSMFWQWYNDTMMNFDNGK